jgi:ABC-2 type transport system ATP-binding protein
MENNIIQINGLHKKYGDQTVVDNLTLNIREGEVFGLLGPNGAGKSTTIRMILGFCEPSGGSITLGGFSAAKETIQVKKLVGYLPEDVGFYSNMSGFENLMYTARLNNIPFSEAEKRINELLSMVQLEKEATKKVEAYSRGMKQRLGLADVLVKNPRIIILDEPTLGLDPNGMRDLLNRISELSKSKGLTVLFSSHHLHQVQHICDRVGLFVNGKLIAHGDIQSLSDELFAKSAVVIEARVDSSVNSNSKKPSISQLIDKIKNIEGVSNVLVNGDMFTTHCSSNKAADIAKIVIENNYGLLSLNKKEYGLDDIYHKYFEGGE